MKKPCRFFKTILPTSLATRFVVLVIIGEIAFGFLLGATMGLYGLRLAATERQTALNHVVSAVAATLMPVVADQDPVRLEAQMRSLLELDLEGAIYSIRVVDSSGAVFAAVESDSKPEEVSPGGTGALSWLTETQVVERAVVVGNLPVATVVMEFGPPDVRDGILPSALSALIVIVSVTLVSIPWTAWLFIRNVGEPLGALREGAQELAKGSRNIRLRVERHDEIGGVAAALDNMARQVDEKERALRELFEQRERTYALEVQSKDELHRLAKMKLDFVAVASHEIKTPLATIRVYAELLEESEELDPELKTMAEAIVSASSRLTSVVSDLMDTALLERGLMPLQFQEVALDGVLARSVGDMGALARDGGVRLELSGTLPSMRVWGDALRLRQVLDNLLSNAIKYSDGAQEVLVSAHVVGSMAEVRVRDFGRGIAEERRHLLFRMFGRLDSGDDRDTVGLGLGLAISARIIAAHGGSIVAPDNDDGVGATFVMCVPLVTHEEELDHAMVSLGVDTDFREEKA